MDEGIYHIDEGILMDMSILEGKILVAVHVNYGGDVWASNVTGVKDSTYIEFICKDGKKYRLYHEQDCCEDVYISAIDGNIDDLIGKPVLQAEMSVSDKKYDGSVEKWTFYQLATVKGYVSIRWIGLDEGYYSLAVSFKEIVKD